MNASVEELIIQGYTRYQAGEFKEAINLWTRALEQDSELVYSSRIIRQVVIEMIDDGHRHFQLQQIQEALELFEYATLFNPQDWVAWYNYGNALTPSGRVPDAIIAYLRSLDLYKENSTATLPIIWNNLGMCHSILQDYIRADEAFDQALSIKPDHIRAYVGKAVIAYNTEQYELATNIVAKGLAIDPSYEKLLAIKSALANLEDAAD